MGYIGSTPTTQSFIAGTDYFNGNGSTTAFTLSRPVVSVNDIQAVVNNVVQVPNDAYNVSGSTITFTSAPSSGTGNVYVRYMSTTTQSITPSQNTVSYATWDNDLRSETFAFKNRLINGDMQIDQRNAGASVTPAGSQYTLDRWNLEVDSARLSVQQNAGSITPPAGFSNYLGITTVSAFSIISTSQFSLRQIVEGFNSSDFAWGTVNASPVTLSFWVRSSLIGNFGGAFRNADNTRSYPFSYSISAANTWEQKSITLVGDTSGTWLTNNQRGIQVVFGLGVGSTLSGTAGSWSTNNFSSVTGAVSVVTTLNATWQVTGVQLEKGTTATNFDVLPYGTELALCQRYYQTFIGSQYLHSASGGANNTTNVNYFKPFVVEMRTAPTFTFSGSFNADGTSYISHSDLYCSYLVTLGARIQGTLSGATAGQYYGLTHQSTGARLNFSAEL
jgi:hypothetical protein